MMEPIFAYVFGLWIMMWVTIIVGVGYLPFIWYARWEAYSGEWEITKEYKVLLAGQIIFTIAFLLDLATAIGAPSAQYLNMSSSCWGWTIYSSFILLIISLPLAYIGEGPGRRHFRICATLLSVLSFIGLLIHATERSGW